MVNKMTKRKWYNEIISIVEASQYENKAEVLAFIDHEIELLNRKSSKPTETKTQKENKTIIAQIETALAEVGKPVTISELQAASSVMAQYSNQKISALLRQMTPDIVIKTTEKKKSYFSLNTCGE